MDIKENKNDCLKLNMMLFISKQSHQINPSYKENDISVHKPQPKALS